MDQLLARADGDMALVQELAGLFLEGCPQLMATIRDAAARGDACQLAQAAHTLKGSVSPFGAEAAVAAALRLEMMGREGELAGVEAAWATLQEAITRLRPALDALAAGQDPRRRA
jgi:HPt (histidine-containing phosphotransfer) domain-containing protein